MKFNITKLVDALINFNINFSVGSFLIGVFNGDYKGYIAGAIFFVAFILFCLKKGE